mmetsp:Transcript_135628/g.338367  ORF Transcript_135628/g.338367 Transcript_135628/m.338367 type:complete len:203 (-) Transcript_135628:413-1021(-)
MDCLRSPVAGITTTVSLCYSSGQRCAIEVREHSSRQVVNKSGRMVEQHVLRLDIVVRLAELLVQILHTAEELREQARRPSLWGWDTTEAGDSLRKVSASTPLHHDEGAPRVTEAPQRADDVGMALVAKPVEVAGVGGVVRSLRHNRQPAAPLHCEVCNALDPVGQAPPELVLFHEVSFAGPAFNRVACCRSWATALGAWGIS